LIQVNAFRWHARFISSPIYFTAAIFLQWSNTMRHIIRTFHSALGCVAAVVVATAGLATTAVAQTPTNGLIMLLEFEQIEGLRHWERELDQRGLTALVEAQYDIMRKYPQDFVRLAAKGYSVAGNDAEKPFWDMPYDQQLARMRQAKKTVETITHKPMRVFGSRYFAYDENTLKAADVLGVEYVLGRGTAGALATIYAPRGTRRKSSPYRTCRSATWAPARCATTACGLAAPPPRTSRPCWTR
jgi:hypothetical protein